MNSWHYSVENSSYLKMLDLLSCVYLWRFISTDVLHLCLKILQIKLTQKRIFFQVFLNLEVPTWVPMLQACAVCTFLTLNMYSCSIVLLSQTFVGNL